MKPKLSICFTVYNQSTIMRKRLEELSQCIEPSIEVIISDDCSTDNLRSLVEEFQDSRFQYFCTPKNLGQDLNILYGIEHCRSDYVFVFRTRDTISISNLDCILKTIEQFPNAGYYLFSAYYEDGSPRLRFRDHVYLCGKEAAHAHFTMLEHPSGNLYNKRYMDTELYRQYINKFFDNIYGFVVHELIRCDLAKKADFVTSSVFGWMYADSLKARDISVNNRNISTSIFSPQYCYPRYRCTFEFAWKELLEQDRLYYLKNIVNKNYMYIIGRVPIMMKDTRYQVHYPGKQEKIKRSKELNVIDDVTRELIEPLKEDERKKISYIILRDSFFLLTIYPIYEFLRNLLIRTPLFDFYKRILSLIRQ